MFEESPPRMKALLRANDSAAGVYKGVATRLALPPLSDKVEERCVHEPNETRLASSATRLLTPSYFVGIDDPYFPGLIGSAKW